MNSRTMSAVLAEPRAERYERTERALWDHYDLQPIVHFVELGSPRVRLRVLEVGAGKPLLFIHGTVGPGSWPSLIKELPGVRCLILDRPGWEPSEAVDFSHRDHRRFVAEIQRGVLDALDIDKTDVAGASIGDLWALSLAEHEPARVGRLLLLGAGPLVSEVRLPPFIRVLASPLGAIVTRLPMRPNRLRSVLRDNGHGASLDAGRIPDQFIDWRLSLANDTASTRHERDMVRTLVQGSGWRPGFLYDDEQLSRIEHPTLMVQGTADPVGSPELWRRVVGALPHGELRWVDGAGHMPWFDDPRQVTAYINEFLDRPSD